MTRRRSYPCRDTRLLILIVAAFPSSLSRYSGSANYAQRDLAEQRDEDRLTRFQLVAFHLIDTAAWSLARHIRHRSRRSVSRTLSVGCSRRTCASASLISRSWRGTASPAL